ncbi:MAG: hypothetical protein JJV97_05920 [SAR324 cluster bacterium]|nr:hypothetical protein [SAR324 cluster bacterium]
MIKSIIYFLQGRDNFFSKTKMRSNKAILWFLLISIFLPSSMVVGQSGLGIITDIKLVPRKNDRDVLVLGGQTFDMIDPVLIQRLDYVAGDDEKDYQWMIILPNADLSTDMKTRLNASNSTVTNQGGNSVERIKIEVTVAKNFGILKSTVLMKVKVSDRYYVERAFAAPVEDINEVDLKEIIFKRGYVDETEQFLESQLSTIKESGNANLIDNQANLPVPILRLNVIGYDGAKTIINSKATQLALYLNEHRREEINQKFGIQFFVNSISLADDRVLDKTIIYYKDDKISTKQRFLKEALYIAKIIPSDSIIKPMVDQNQKTNVDIEIYVGKNLK